MEYQGIKLSKNSKKTLRSALIELIKDSDPKKQITIHTYNLGIVKTKTVDGVTFLINVRDEVIDFDVIFTNDLIQLAKMLDEL